MKLNASKVAMWVGGATWVLVTLAALSVILEAPSEHVDLAIGLAMIWFFIIGFAALIRFTGRI